MGSCCHDPNSHEICPWCKGDPGLLRLVYVFGIGLWIAIVSFVGWRWRFWNFLDWIIVALPIVLFIIAMCNMDCITPYIQSNVLRNSNMSSIVIIIFPILVWATARVNNTPRFLLLVLLATGLSVVSVVDFWVSENYLPVVRHLRSVAETLSIALTLLALVQYYKDRTCARKTGEGELTEHCDAPYQPTSMYDELYDYQKIRRKRKGVIGADVEEGEGAVTVEESIAGGEIIAIAGIT